jgi:hypothetical protein
MTDYEMQESAMDRILTFLTTNRIAVVLLRWCFWFAVLLSLVVVFAAVSILVDWYMAFVSMYVRGVVLLFVLALVSFLMAVKGSKALK